MTLANGARCPQLPACPCAYPQMRHDRGMNGYNFTERVRQVLALARDEAARLHHEYVGTEHILLAIVREGDGVGAAIIQNLGIELETVQQARTAIERAG